MNDRPSRRDFLKVSVVAGCGAGFASLAGATASGPAESSGKIKKAVLISMLPK